MRKFYSVVIAILVVLVCIAAAGMYKFNYLASQPGYNVDGNRID
jgi:PDZ domain-containing secreted protein